MTGDGAPDDGPRSGAPGPALELEGVTFSFGRIPVLEEVDLRVDRGDFLGIIGPNGAGKTTLLRLALGLLEPDRGSVRVLGGTPAEARGRVGYVPQHARFQADFPILVREVVLMGRLGDGDVGQGWSGRDREAAARALERVEMEDLGERPVGSLSGGQLQRTLVARALAMEPELLLLDEPTASVDTRIGRRIYRLLEGLTERMTVVLVSHDIGVLSREVRSVACLNRRLHYHGTGRMPREALEEAYGGEVELVAHGPHRVLDTHGGEEG